MDGSLGASYDGTVDDSEIEITAADVMVRLKQAWLNEKLSPELLEHKAELVDCMLEQIQQMNHNLKGSNKGDFKVAVHRLEMERIQFIISNYLKIRLQKMENHSAEILEVEKNLRLGGQPPRLSEEEFNFLKSYVGAMTAHLQNTTLKTLPTNMQTFDLAAAVSKADTSSYVFFRVKEPNHSIYLKDEGFQRDDIIDLEIDSQHLLPYKAVSQLMKDSAISLI